MNSAPGVLVIAGPTASGKTELALSLAKRFDAEIVSADSRQIYAGMPLGTAAPTEEQLRAVRHHLVGFLDPYERYSAARFAADAAAAIEAIHRRGKRAIVAGGTGFYIRALTGGVALAPQYDESLRDRLAHESRVHDAEFLYEWLRVRGSRRAAALYPADTYRVLRALEVALAPEYTPERVVMPPDIRFLKIALQTSEEALWQAINARTDAMLAGRFVEEAERIGAGAVAANAVGYPQALAYLRGWSSFDEFRELLIRRTCRYAKRQMTWFRSEPQMIWAQARDVERLAKENLAWV